MSNFGTVLLRLAWLLAGILPPLAVPSQRSEQQVPPQHSVPPHVQPHLLTDSSPAAPRLAPPVPAPIEPFTLDASHTQIAYAELQSRRAMAAAIGTTEVTPLSPATPMRILVYPEQPFVINGPAPLPLNASRQALNATLVTQVAPARLAALGVLLPQMERHSEMCHVTLPPYKLAGAIVEEVIAGSPAGSLGLRPGDLIEAINGTPMKFAADVAAYVAGLSPRDAITVTYAREDQRFTATAHLQSLAEVVLPTAAELQVRMDKQNKVQDPRWGTFVVAIEAI